MSLFNILVNLQPLPVYMDIDEAAGAFTLRVMTSGPGYRRWNIRVSQIECNNPLRAPQNCLQYYMGPSGSFSSFNHESTRPLTEQPNWNLPEQTYFNNLDYSICFRKEVGFCTQTYTVNTSFVSMEISAHNVRGRPTFD